MKGKFKRNRIITRYFVIYIIMTYEVYSVLSLKISLSRIFFLEKK